MSALPAAPIAFASLILYLVLGAASLGVMLRTRARPHSRLRMQINSWCLLFPAVSASLLLYPLERIAQGKDAEVDKKMQPPLGPGGRCRQCHRIKILVVWRAIGALF